MDYKMKKLEKFFKNTNITIDKNHKENVKKEIFKNYNSAYSIKNKIFTLKTLNLSLVSTASIIIIIFISIIIYNSYKDEGPKLYLKDLSDGVVRSLSARKGLNIGATWFPDGSKEASADAV